MIWLILFSAAVAVILKWIYEIKTFNAYLKHVPGPTPLPILGNALDLMYGWRILPTLERYRNDFGGGITKVIIGPDKAKVVAFDYKFLEMVLSSMKIIDKTPDYRHFHKWLGLGLLTSTGEKWQKRRKLLTPSFHFQILENFLDVFHNQTDVLVECMRSQLGSNSFDVYNYITLSALDVICESAMGITMNAQLDVSSEYVQSVKEMGRIVIEKSTHPFKQFDFLYQFSKDYRKEQKAMKVLHETTDNVIRKRRELLLKNNNQKVEENEDGTKKRLAFLDLLLQATTPDGKSLTDADIREEVDTFMFEGHDTTSSGMSFCLYMLSKHPDVQAKVFEEIRDILGDDKKKAPGYKDLQEMKYLELVINETLRLYPSVPVFGRELTEDTEFEGHIYPKGLSILLPAFSIHRDERHFPDPLKFDPERFSLENKSNRKPFSYFPFSAGPRNCIGQKFAMLEMKSTISKVLRHYELLEAPEFEPVLSAETILKSLNGVHIRIKERSY